jgi:superfamily II DNA or RNA helicase/HKD family nuclease
MSTPKQPIGLYEQVVNAALQTELEALSNECITDREKLDTAEAPDRLAMYVGKLVERVVSGLNEKDRLDVSRNLVNSLIEVAKGYAPKANLEIDKLPEELAVLRGIFGIGQDGRATTLARPLTPLLDTTLITNDRNEPKIAAQIKGEIHSADRIDIVMAFVRYSGIKKFIEEFKRFLAKPEKPRLRVLTTTYTNSTELTALQALTDLGAEIRVSYDVGMTRLHAKAWYFYRRSGASTAFIGSSNLTHSAQDTGKEWNVRASALRNPDVTRKVASMFEAYWESGDFEPFDTLTFQRNTAKEEQEQNQTTRAFLEVTLKPFQERLLEQIEISRDNGRHWNLLVSATGTGKTVMAGMDYSRLKTRMPHPRLLFVAHRKEILEQSRDTFRQILQDWQFGQLWVDGERPSHFEHVFASIQTLSNADLSRIPPDHYDVVIIDEFHHAAASTYQRLLAHLQPKQLLALTATPERADGESLLHLFNNEITAELRLWDAIDQHFLVPFEYYGVNDGTNLSDIPWTRGRGYDTAALANVYTADDLWVKRVIRELANRVECIDAVVGLGFCVSIAHADFMALKFNQAGIAAASVSGKTGSNERESTLRKLNEGSLKFVFSVDVFNEGVDIPKVNTLLLLRPTESATIFIQQLGRGLRRAPRKEICTILDFVGQHNKAFRFDKRLGALLGGTRKDLERQVEQGFPYLPSGCYMELDPVAQKTILASLKNAIPSSRNALANELRALKERGADSSLTAFLEHTGLALEDIYKGGGDNSWSALCEAAGIEVKPQGPNEAILRKALGRLLHIDDSERLSQYAKWAAQADAPILSDLKARKTRLLRMLVASLCNELKDKHLSLEHAVDLVWQHSQVLAELQELVVALQNRISHKHSPYEPFGDNPLQIHARYTRIEMLAAYGEGDNALTPTWREGVKWSQQKKTDVMAFTLSKTPGRFSPTTMYRDYAINQNLIHWETQSQTSEASATGQRYIHHQKQGSHIALFARETSEDRAFWCLGKARYVEHEGERPMAIKWRLERSLPGDLYGAFVAAVA